ncbi:MAG TPA: hypothetical protein DF292_02210, partial [Firmicutes bacterium]|nr:hypothetical protein [Bacillota bacterium]HCT35835.1 hypothetical protein [Bacillota bacterium]
MKKWITIIGIIGLLVLLEVVVGNIPVFGEEEQDAFGQLQILAQEACEWISALGSLQKQQLNQFEAQALIESQAVARAEKLFAKFQSSEAAIRQQMGATEQVLVNMGMSAQIMQRHDDAVDQIAQGFSQLYNALLLLQDRKAEQGFSVRVQACERVLKKITFEEKATFDAVPLFRENGLQPQPASAPEQSQSEIVPSYIKEASGVKSAYSTLDLVETIEVQFTDGIKDLADSLEKNPAKIYDYVYNKIDFELYCGSVKGADLTLRSGKGNDFDIASLLIALLRYSDYPARYVYGSAMLSYSQLQNWLGASTEGCFRMLQTKHCYFGASDRGVRVNHVWVEAYVPYSDYRGTQERGSGSAWIPIDASFKEYVDLPADPLPEEHKFVGIEYLRSGTP